MVGQDPLNSDALTRVYRSLRLIRHAEEEIARIYPSDKIKSPVHLSIGQEAVSVGVCDALLPSDIVSATYRGHAAYIAKGGDLRRMFAELYGKATGIAGGKGGSMHLIDVDHGVLGSSAVVGTTIPIACGYALALKRERKGRAVVAFLGDGATEEGVFYESINFAALHRLPVLFVCENNRYAIHTPIGKRWATEQLCRKVEAFGLPVHRIGDSDVFAVREWTAGALAAIRAGGGPSFLECITYRWREHVGPNEDYDAGYRSRAELEPWQASDQVERVARMLSPDVRTRVDAEVVAEVGAAVAFAESSPFPEANSLYRHVYAD